MASSATTPSLSTSMCREFEDAERGVSGGLSGAGRGVAGPGRRGAVPNICWCRDGCNKLLAVTRGVTVVQGMTMHHERKVERVFSLRLDSTVDHHNYMTWALGGALPARQGSAALTRRLSASYHLLYVSPFCRLYFSRAMPSELPCVQ